MGTALTTALSGLATSQQQIDVVGNNIANVNTVGYKATSIDFKTQFLQSFSYGSAPSSTSGGTNPLQVGLGAQSGAITTNFNDGSLQSTGVATDLAIQGNGFFVLKDGTSQVYSRDGTFLLNNKDQLVSSTGQLVQGYGVDSNFNVVPGVLGNITIPLGQGMIAQATTSASFTGNLNASGTPPTTVSDLTSQPLYLSNGSGGTNPTTPPTGATVLSNITTSNGTPLFQVGDIVTLTGKRGGVSLANSTMTVTSGTKLSDLQSFLTGSLGIDTAAGANGAVATTPGTTIPVDGTFSQAVDLKIDGNPGTFNDLSLNANSITITRAGSPVTPFTWAKNATANGESISTSMNAFDSLGTSVPVTMTAVMVGKNTSGSTWQYYATSPNSPTSATPNTLVGAGVLTFDTAGNFLSSSSNTITIDRSNTGAVANLAFTVDFSGVNALTGTTSSLQESTQDGATSGTMTSFSIANDGTITGSFSNGISRKVAQVALATFQNNEGLVNDGNNTYSSGPNSGIAVITAPTQLSAGKIVGGSLEGSNVDLSSEFVKMISASTAFSASSRVITSSNTLLQDLLAAAR